MTGAANAASALFANSVIFDARIENARKAVNTHARN